MKHLLMAGLLMTGLAASANEIITVDPGLVVVDTTTGTVLREPREMDLGFTLQGTSLNHDFALRSRELDLQEGIDIRQNEKDSRGIFQKIFGTLKGGCGK